MSNTEPAGGNNISNTGAAVKSPVKLLSVVILAFLIPILAIIWVVSIFSQVIPSGAKPNSLAEEAVASRIQPVAGLAITDAAAGEVVVKTGKEVYDTTCSACHSSGVAGAPKFGDAGEWGPYIKLGYDTLLHNALNGINAMPARGGNSALSDLEVARAVVFMTNESGADFPEPEEGSAAGDAAADSSATDTTADAPAEQTEASEPQSGTSVDLAVGEKLYNQICVTCHSIGLAGAPKPGNKEQWGPYLATGMDTMLKNAISGVGAMPPRGSSNASDEELLAAIEFMIQGAK